MAIFCDNYIIHTILLKCGNAILQVKDGNNIEILPNPTRNTGKCELGGFLLRQSHLLT